MKFYLSGAMEYKEDLGMGWRDWLTKELENRRHEAVDPVKLESPDEDGNPIQRQLSRMKAEGNLKEVREICRRSIFRKDMFGIQLAEALVVYYDIPVQQGAGTISECWESFREGRPIYLVTHLPLEQVPTWLIAETTEVFSDFEGFLAYVDNHSNVIRDMMNAKKIVADVLGGIYDE